MKAYVVVDVQIHIFLTSALVGGERSTSRPGRFTPGERASGTHWIGCWVDLRDGLDYFEKILDPTGTRTPTPRSSSPYLVTTPTTWWNHEYFVGRIQGNIFFRSAFCHFIDFPVSGSQHSGDYDQKMWRCGATSGKKWTQSPPTQNDYFCMRSAPSTRIMISWWLKLR
jgi:hypothetical protein